jgi:predicted phage terminase large subunit-like protein
MGATMFNAQYLQAPVPDTGNMLKINWLRRYRTPPLRQKGDLVVQSWDTALKATETSNFSVCLTFLTRNGNEHYLLDVRRERLEFPELAKCLGRHATKFDADAVLVEDQASGISLIQYAKQAGVKGVIGIKPEGDKKTRMLCQTPKLEAGSLILPQSASWLSEFVAEYLAFPAGRYDDQIDALSQFLTWQSARKTSVFSCDWGFDDQPGMRSLSPEELHFRLGRF